MDQLKAMINQHGARALFSDQGIQFTKNALGILKRAASAAASTVRIPNIRDKIPDHIREDILSQSYNMIEVLGRCSFILILFESRRVDPDDEDLIRIFAAMYTNACERDDELRKLCRLTIETYAETGYLEKFSSMPDKEY
jgi:hypothetical protein